MTGQAQVPVPTTARATQHIRLPHTHDAYEHLCVLTVTIKPGPSPPLCWQIHRCLAVPVPTLRLWVHCPRASDGLLPPRLYLIGYVRWDARSNHSSLLDNHVQQLTDRTVPKVCPFLGLQTPIRTLPQLTADQPSLLQSIDESSLCGLGSVRDVCLTKRAGCYS